MKNLKKVLALVVVFAMMISTVAFASYPDVDTTADYAGAVELLSALDILKGDDQGNFNPENTITRAEFAAVVCRALGLENSANSAKGATAFTDVAADHWASGYINLASQQKIVNGRGNGIFDPNGNVTFAEAVKMLVVALGYEPMASQRGGYPTGYLTVANSTKLTANVSAGGTNTAALRKTVAMLTANALEIPMMDQTGFGSDVTFEVLDDYDNYQTLLTNRDIYVATGTVGDTDKEEGTVNFKFTAASDDYEFGYNNKGEAKDELGEDDFVIADSNIEEYYQQNVKAYVYKASKSEYEVLIAVPSGIGSTLTLDANDIEVGKLGDESKAVEYYATAEATKTTKIYVDDKYESYVNGVKVTVADLAVFAGKDAVIEFVENTDDKYYDRVLVTVYENAIVEKVDADEPEFSRITLVNNDKIDLDLEDEDLIINIVDKDGNAMDLADFAQYDVLSIVVGELEMDEDEYTTTPVEAKNFAEEITIINLGQSSVTGSITEASEEYIYIDDAEYEVGAFVDGNALEVFEKVGEIDTAKLATEGVFFISATGKIIGFDGEAAANSDYGYIIETYYKDGGFASNRTWEVCMLTAEGINTYDLHTTVKVGTEEINKVPHNNPFFAAFEVEDAEEEGDAEEEVEVVEEDAEEEVEVEVADRIVEFKLTSDGKIKAISNVEDVVDAEGIVEYKAASNKLGSKRLSANTIIFDISKDDAEDYKATDISSLVDEGKYNGYFVDKKNNEYKLFVMTSGSAAFDAEAPLMFVDSVRKSTYGSEEAVTVKYITAGSKTVADAIFVTDEADDIYGGAKFSALSKGDVFVANINAEGLVAEYAVLAQLTEKEGVFDLDVDAEVLAKLHAADEDVQFMYGNIATIDEEDITATNNVGFDETLTLTGGFNEYQFNTRIKTPAVQLSSWDRNGVTVDYPVFIKLFDGEVIDVYTVTNLVESVESVE